MSLSPTEAAILAAFGASAIFAVPSPWHGPYGGRLARDFGTLIRAVCAFASGAAFAPMSSPPWALKSDREQEVREKLAKGVRLLHVKGVLIGPTMIAMASAGSPECLDRVRGALFAYEQALMQPSEFVTIILLVTAIEALSVPNATWRRRRVT